MLLVVAYLVATETRNRMAGIAAAGLLAATFPLSTSFDAAHVDALFLFLLMAGIAVVRLRTGAVALFTGGVLIGLASLTKVPIGAAPVAAALALYLLAMRRAGAAPFVVGCVLTVAAAVLGLRIQNGGWATWYLFDLPSMHAVNNHGDGLARFWFADILPRFSLPLLIGPVFLLRRAAMRRYGPLVFYALVCGSLLAVGWAARSNSGGASNVLLPGHVAVALLFGLGVDGLLGLLGGGSRQFQLLRAYVLALCIAQFALLVYNPRLMVPYRSEQWAGERLSATLANLDGPLFAPNLDGYLRGTSKGEQPYVGALLEITGSYGGRGTSEGEQWKADFATALQQRRYSHVVLIEDCCNISAALAQAGYVSAGPLFPPGDDYWLWTNGRTPDDIQVFVPPAT
jgi:4-amino-4-deoxy-L-arabinose transferase-like glycosyltransferase